MFLLFYQLIFGLALMVCSPILLFRIITQRHYREGLRERLGLSLLSLSKSKKERIWIHGASVGEHQTILPFLDDLKLHFPEYEFVFSATTMAGIELLKNKKLKAFYFPLDLYWITKKVLKQIQPKLIIILETELWPAFITSARKMNIPLTLINGRISDFSFRRYLVVKMGMKKILNYFSLICVQTAEDRNRFLRLRIFPEKLRVTGNLKFDAAALRLPSKEEILALKQELQCENSDLIAVAGSTHHGEEELLAQIYLRLRKRFHSLRLIIAPRHLTRIPEIEKILSKLQIPYRTRSTLKKGNKRPGVILLNTIGELFKVYGLANLVFVGRSLYAKGGQNPLEPAILSKPILFGPHMENFKEASQALLQAKGALSVATPEALEEKLTELLHQPEWRQEMGKNAASIFATHRGAAEKTWQELKKEIPLFAPYNKK